MLWAVAPSTSIADWTSAVASCVAAAAAVWAVAADRRIKKTLVHVVHHVDHNDTASAL